jgi:hypothetical protein
MVGIVVFFVSFLVHARTLIAIVFNAHGDGIMPLKFRDMFFKCMGTIPMLS